MKSKTLATGKTHRQENFPVASRLIKAEHRPIILAFYLFARAADDVADDPDLTPARKIAGLDAMERSLIGEDAGGAAPEAAQLRLALAERRVTSRHALDLLAAFRLDVTKKRYADWADLMAYCALSAMPVGRFVLDVHGESPTTWPASDAICAALQIINHLQDCGADYRNLDRVYLPLDALAADGVGPEALDAKFASPGLRACLGEIAGKVAELLRDGQGLADEIKDWRLRYEISIIHALAVRLTNRLKERDPLSEETHLGGFEAATTAGLAIVHRFTRGLGISPRVVASGVRS
jgi:squalene synthase HpnC